MGSTGLNVLFLLIIVSFASGVSCYKILGIFPILSSSHYVLGNELIKRLAEAGHEATILTVFEEKNPPNENYKQIILEGLADKQKATFGSYTLSTSFFKSIFNFYEDFSTLTEMTLNHTMTQKLIKSRPKFDVVIVPQFSLEALKALAPHFGAHLVIFNNFGASSFVSHFVGNPTLPSITSDPMLGHVGQRTFAQRLYNSLYRSLDQIYVNVLVCPYHKDMVHKYISEDLDLEKIMYNVSLVIGNAHYSLNEATSSVPCMIDVAGFHVRATKKLPEDLQKYLDDSKNGVIYFSMGSTVKSADLSVETRNILMKVFSKRKERILWKFEDDDMPGKPDNVKISKWLPQSDLLAHPNVKLFITHGGFLSMIETVYHGVPTVTIPVFGDQFTNANQAQLDEYSEVLNLESLSEEVLFSAIEKVISDKKYRENVKYRSKIFHDRHTTPMDNAIYWIEYIVRYNGAPHLRVPYIHLAWYQYYSLDVFGSIVGVLFFVLFITKKTGSFIFVRLFGNKNNLEKVKNQ